MATATIAIPVLALIADGTNPPAYTHNGGRGYWAFDSSTDEIVYFGFRLPDDYSSTPALDVEWSGTASTTTADGVAWACSVMKSTGDTDGSPVSDAYDATANVATDQILGTTAGRHQTVSISLSNFDSGAAGDLIWCKLFRDVSDAADDLGEDARLWGLAFTYTTT